MLQRLAAPLRPVMTPIAENGPAETVELEETPVPQNGRREEGAVINDDTPPAAVNDDPPRGQDDLQGADQQQHLRLPHARQKKSVSPAARWSSTMDYMRDKLEKEEESKKTALDIQKEELKLKKEELEVRKLEVTNDRLRIEAQQREQQRRADLEEKRRKEEGEERKLMMDRQNEERKEMMDRQNKLMDAMLQLIQANKK